MFAVHSLVVHLCPLFYFGGGAGALHTISMVGYGDSFLIT
jgi:hypothetical protein